MRNPHARIKSLLRTIASWADLAHFVRGAEFLRPPDVSRA